MSQYQKLRACPICRSEDTFSRLSEVKPNLNIGSETFGFMSCVSCSHVFLKDPPNSLELGNFYARLPPSLEAASPDVRTANALWNHLAEPSFRRLAARLPQGKILDVGCGRGDLMEFLVSNGRECEGVDFDGPAIEIARRRGLRVASVDLATWDAGAARYDGIVMRHVLEHVPDPADLLRRLRLFLKPNGRIVVEVPNVKSLVNRLSGRHWNGWDPPFHLQQFTARSLTAALQRAGYAEITCSSYGSVEEYRHSYGRFRGKAARYDILRVASLPLAVLSGPLMLGGALLSVASREGNN